MSLNGKSAIVTGGGQGIGLAIARSLAADGASIVVADVNEETAQKAADELIAGGAKAIAVAVDVRNAEQVEAMVAKTIEAFGQVDILVNNAGITRDGLVMRMSELDWDLVLDINLKGSFLCTRAVAKSMLKARSGCIVNIASVIGLMGNAGQANYAASKAGIIGLTKATAKEFAPRGVRVNAVAPGFIQTEMTAKLPEEAREALAKQIPLGTLGVPEDVAKAVAFLCSEGAAYTTGHVLNVDGGMVM